MAKGHCDCKTTATQQATEISGLENFKNKKAMLKERGFFHRQINLYKNLNFYLTITNNCAKG